MNVVLVHGFLDSASLMRRVSEPLSRAGHSCHAPSLKPCDGRAGLEALSGQLAGFIEAAFPRGEPFAIVGFSMGALVSRHYLQAGGGAGRVRAFFSVGGPHQGTYTAYLYPGKGTRQMRFGSAFLSGLAAGSHALVDLCIVSYWSPYDAMIRPVSSAWLPVGERVRVPALLHVGMLSHPRLHADLCVRLRTLR